MLTSSTKPDGGSLPSTSTTNQECSRQERQYDANAFAASLALAVANELHRWDALSDFELRSGQLTLSATGELHCQAGCSNIRAILSLQDAASSVVPQHDPAAFRSRLASWYTEQKSALSDVMEQRLVVDKGVYRLRNRGSGKYMQVDAGSLSDNAAVEQRTTPSQPGSNEWRVVLDHTTHQLVNVRSGKCLSLSLDSAEQNVTLVQQTCSGAALQRFGFAKTFEYYGLISKTGQALRVRDNSTADDAPLVQASTDISQPSQQWALEAVDSAGLSPDAIADGMYTIVAMRSGKSITIDSDDTGENAAVEQDTFSANDDRYQWYVTRVGKDKYSFANHRSGKCLDLESTAAAGHLLQRTCSSATTQRFTLTAAGDGTHVLYSSPGNAVEIEGDSSDDRAPLSLGSDSSWADHRRFVLTPVLAGEPHQLSFSHATAAGPCGDYYYWYDIQQPNGQPLRAPGDAFLQLMFVGGRQTSEGSDDNRFLQQQPGQAALDPLGHLIRTELDGSELNGTEEMSDSCVASDLLYDPTGAAAGGCCSKYDGKAGKLEKASWSPALFLCR